MQASTSPTPAPPAQPATAPVVANPDVVPSPSYVYEAARATRQELRQQQDALIANRHTYLRELEDHEVAGPATSGMQQRIVQLDARIAELDKAIAAADAEVAKAASIPGAVTIQPSSPQFNGPPEEFYVGGTFILLAAILPISIAFARRLWRRGSTAVQEFPRELMERLARLEQMGETTAIEVERIGEGQRFVTRLMTERAEHALGEGPKVPK